MSRARLYAMFAIGSAVAMGVAGFAVGEAYSRRQISALADQMAAEGPTNSFTRCLTQMWEESGELDKEWKGKRKWQLVEMKP